MIKYTKKRMERMIEREKKRMQPLIDNFGNLSISGVCGLLVIVKVE